MTSSNKTINKESSDIMKEVLNRQNPHWQQTYANNPEMFGEEPSEPALKAAELFKNEGKINILELGGGQGRDTMLPLSQLFAYHD